METALLAVMHGVGRVCLHTGRDYGIATFWPDLRGGRSRRQRMCFKSDLTGWLEAVGRAPRRLP